MATGASGIPGVAGFTAAGGYAGALPVLEADEAPVEAISEATSEVGARAEPHIIEISDADYRSFCFPCHALEEVEDCNDGY